MTHREDLGGCVWGGGGGAVRSCPHEEERPALLLPRSGDTGHAGAPPVLSVLCWPFTTSPVLASGSTPDIRHAVRSACVSLTRKSQPSVKRKEPITQKSQSCPMRGAAASKSIFYAFPAACSNRRRNALAQRGLLESHAAESCPSACTCKHTHARTHTCKQAHICMRKHTCARTYMQSTYIRVHTSETVHAKLNKSDRTTKILKSFLNNKICGKQSGEEKHWRWKSRNRHTKKGEWKLRFVSSVFL